jgi:hypothetical protein
MDGTIALVTLIVVAAVVLFPRIVRRVRFVRLVNKIPGPPSYPLIGSVFDLLLQPRNSKYYREKRLLPLESFNTGRSKNLNLIVT